MSDNTRQQLMDLLEALDGGDYADIADAIFDALHPKVTTVEAIIELPVGAVIVNDDTGLIGTIATPPGWGGHKAALVAGDSEPFPLSAWIGYNSRVLYRPNTEETR